MRRIFEVLSLISILFIASMITGCGSDKNTNPAQGGAKTEQANALPTNNSNLGLTAEEFIASYNKVLDNIVKQGHSNANYYKIDVNKVKDNTIVLDGIATLSWHLNGGYIDAVTETVPNPPVEGINISEMAIIIVTTQNQETLKTVTDRVAAHEQQVAFNQGNIFILRQSNFQVQQGVRGTSLVVCTNEYRDKLMEAVKAMSKAMSKDKQKTDNVATTPMTSTAKSNDDKLGELAEKTAVESAKKGFSNGKIFASTTELIGYHESNPNVPLVIVSVDIDYDNLIWTNLYMVKFTDDDIQHVDIDSLSFPKTSNLNIDREKAPYIRKWKKSYEDNYMKFRMIGKKHLSFQ